MSDQFPPVGTPTGLEDLPFPVEYTSYRGNDGVLTRAMLEAGNDINDPFHPLPENDRNMDNIQDQMQPELQEFRDLGPPIYTPPGNAYPEPAYGVPAPGNAYRPELLPMQPDYAPINAYRPLPPHDVQRDNVFYMPLDIVPMPFDPTLYLDVNDIVFPRNDIVPMHDLPMHDIVLPTPDPPSEQTVNEEDVVARCEELYPGRLATLSDLHRQQLLDYVYHHELDGEAERQQQAHAQAQAHSQAHAQAHAQAQAHAHAHAQSLAQALREADAIDMKRDGDEPDVQIKREIRPEHADDMTRIMTSFPSFSQHFRLIKRIGEGTFSTVYKAEDLLYDHFDNAWDVHPPPRRHYVAVKKIYATSSPARVFNELALLHALRNQPSVCQIITAFRFTDQILAVLPYYRHSDFRDFFRLMTVQDMRVYMRSLFTALAAIHGHRVLHRDVKPTNFLYDPNTRRGVLVDFGLAERLCGNRRKCLCTESRSTQRMRWLNSASFNNGAPPFGVPRDDPRPPRRANRAGTRGFRAPEVLFKCTSQSPKIDVWSAGVILLTILTRRFPIFNSADDTEALIEMGTIFGTERLRQAGLLHGSVVETNIPTVTQGGYSLDRIVLWSTGRDQTGEDLDMDERMAVTFLERCLDLDPNKRISAREALEHSFLQEGESDPDDEMDLIEQVE